MKTKEGSSDELEEPRLELELGLELLEPGVVLLDEPELLLPPRLLPLVPPVLLELEALNKDQGTGTSFSPVVEVVAPDAEELLLELELLPLLLELSWITAKSMRPELGFNKTSLIVPN